MPKKELEKVFEKEKSEDWGSLSLFVTNNCNLSCAYCYEKKYLRNKKIMDTKLAKEVITEFMIKEDGFNSVMIDFFGGEPLLAFPLIKEVIEWFYTKSWGKKGQFFIGTNGTLLTEEIKKWLIKNKEHITCGFSIDGCPKAHNINRSGSFELLKKNISFFKKNWPLQPAKMTVNDMTISFIAESVQYLEENSILFNGGLVLEDIWGEDDKKNNLLDIYSDQLNLLIEYYLFHPELAPPRPLFPTLPKYLGNCSEKELQKLKKESRKFCGAGNEMVTVDLDGKLYPCHRFLPSTTGKVYPQAKKIEKKGWSPEKCASCKFLPSCPTCIGLNWELNGETSIRTTYHCDAFKIGLQARCKYEAEKLVRINNSEIKKLSKEEKRDIQMNLESVLYILHEGLE